MKYKIHYQVGREGKQEICFDVRNDDDSLVVGNLIRSVGTSELDKTALDILFADKIYPEITAMSEPAEEEATMTTSEVESLLITKGILEPAETLDDLKTLTELKAISIKEVSK